MNSRVEKLQRPLFLCFAGLMLISSLLMTLYVPLDFSKKRPKESVGKLIDGSSLDKGLLEGMVRFIGKDAKEELQNGRSEGHFFNNGIIRKLFVENKQLIPLWHLLSPSFQSELHGQIETLRRHALSTLPRWEKYGVGRIMRHYFPHLDELTQEFLSLEKEVGDRHLEMLMYLYQESELFHPKFVRRLISLESRGQDSPIREEELWLFRAKGFEDWFGKKMLYFLAELILNGARHAEIEGISVSQDEARGHLIAIGLEHALEFEGREIGSDQVELLLQQQARLLGMEENEFVELFRQILLFRRWMDREALTDLVDPLFFQQMVSWAHQQIQVEKLSLAPLLSAQSIDELLQLQHYLEATTDLKGKRRELRFPKEWLSVEEVRQQNPDLVEREFCIRYGEVSIESVMEQIPLKELWSWQEEPSHFALLQHTFPVLDRPQRDRKEALDSLSLRERREVDRFSLKQMILENPHFLEQSLSAIERVETFYLPLAGRVDSLFKGCNVEELNQKLNSLSGKEVFSFDQIHFYQVEILERGSKERIVPLAEAYQSGRLEESFHRYVENRYPHIRILYKEIFESAEGEWKPIDQVRNEVARCLFKDLFQAIEKEAGYEGETLKAEEEFYLSYRWFKEVEKDSLSLRKEESKSLFPLEREIFSLMRKDWVDQCEAKAFYAPLNEWQPAVLDRRPYVYQVLSKGDGPVQLLTTAAIQEEVGRRYCQQALEQLVSKIEKTKAVE